MREEESTAMAENFTQDNLSLTISTPLGQNKLLLTGVRGEEHLSGLFHFTLDLFSEDGDLGFESIVGHSATVVFVLPSGATRYFNGIIGRFVQAGRHARFTTYYADLHPWLWLLTMTRDCRIFQNQSVPDIIEAVFKDLGHTDYKNELKSTYATREYCVQYQESVFDFVSRLMEDEGIFYFFKHEDGKHTLILADDADVHTDCADPATVEWGTAFPDRQGDAIIINCTYAQQVIPNTYAMDDFNFETPDTDLLVTTQGRNGQRRIYDYPGGGCQARCRRKKGQPAPRRL